MRVKLLEAMTANSLQNKVNIFLRENEHLEVKNIQIAAGFGNIIALIQYME